MVRKDGRPPEAGAFEEAVVRYFVGSAELLGLTHSVAAIYGLCVATPEPLGFAEIHDRLDLSIGSISTGVRALVDSGAMAAKRSDDDSRDIFELNREPVAQIQLWFLQRIETQFAEADRRLRQIPSARGEATRARLKSLRVWKQKSRKLGEEVAAMLEASAGTTAATRTRRGSRYGSDSPDGELWR